MMTVIASSEHPDCCQFIRGTYFDYCILIKDSIGYFIEGKGRYGCVTKVRIKEEEAKRWMSLNIK